MDGISSGVIGGVTWGKIDASAWTEKLEPAREGDPERISKAVRERQRRQRRQTAKYMETSPGGSDRRPFLIEKLSPAKSQMEPIHHNGAGRTKNSPIASRTALRFRTHDDGHTVSSIYYTFSRIYHEMT